MYRPPADGQWVTFAGRADPEVAVGSAGDQGAASMNPATTGRWPNTAYTVPLRRFPVYAVPALRAQPMALAM
jgi:hypothetical protein